MDRSNRQKVNREIKELTDVMTQKELTDIYRTFQPNIKNIPYSTLFSAPHGTVSKTDHILRSKANHNRHKKNRNNHLYLIGSPMFKVGI